jgi:hypothetical protein
VTRRGRGRFTESEDGALKNADCEGKERKGFALSRSPTRKIVGIYVEPAGVIYGQSRSILIWFSVRFF